MHMDILQVHGAGLRSSHGPERNAEAAAEAKVPTEASGVLRQVLGSCHGPYRPHKHEDPNMVHGK